MFNVTAIKATKNNDRLMFIASAPDTDLGIPGAMKDVVAFVRLADGTKADATAATLSPDTFKIINVEGGIGEAARR